LHQNFFNSRFFKTKSLEGSRNTQITDSIKIDENYITKEALVLKDVGALYLPIYKKKVADKIYANPIYDDGEDKKKLMSILI